LADSGRIGNCFNFATGISAYDYGIVVANVKDVAQMDAAEKMYKDLLSLGKTVYLDDRDLRFGEKLAEIEAIGTANKLLFGKNVTEGIYEVKQLSNDKWTQEKIF
jgi:prolyl-tRNA synthetase